MRWIARDFVGLNMDGVIVHLAFQATLNHVWLERNSRRFHDKGKTSDSLVSMIVKDDSDKIKNMEGLDLWMDDALLVAKWSIPRRFEVSRVVDVSWKPHALVLYFNL